MSGALTRRALLQALLAPEGQTPNFLFVLVDDLRWDELGSTGHPFASTPHADRLAREGALFTNAFATTPLCSPSRACFLAGQYAHKHGIVDNTSRSERSHQLMTWPRRLREAGYKTGFIGKWHMGNDDSPRPGFDRWISFRGQGDCIDPKLNVDGTSVSARGYITDLLTGYAVQFLEQKREKPFCLYLAHKAIHPNVQQRDDGSVSAAIAGSDAFIPAERHRTLYAGRTPPRRPSYGKAPRGKPALERRIGNLPPLGPETVTPDATILNRMRMMKAVDEGLGQMLATLEKSRRLDDTVVIFTSDHGYFYGEHGLDPERRLAYEEAIRVPLVVRYPRRFQAASRPDRMVLSIDIAPTVFEVAGVKASWPLHGRSLLDPTRREEILVEYYSDTVFPRIRNMGYRAVRTEDWKYIRYLELEGMDELYDLRHDPYEMNNVLTKAPGARVDMQRRLQRLLDLL